MTDAVDEAMSTTGRTKPAPRLVVPAYFHPAARPELWALLAERAAEVRLVILNPANGPGRRCDERYFPALEHLRAAGVAMAGYVDTDYGRRSRRQAEADVARYLDFYGVTGVCFDRAAGGAEQIDHYAELARRARAIGAQVVMFHHGAQPHEAYAEHADLLGTFEGPWRAYLEMPVQRWTTVPPAEKLYHIVYSVPRKHFGDAFLLAARRRAGCAYVTDHGGVNPYEMLPAAWPESPLEEPTSADA